MSKLVVWGLIAALVIGGLVWLSQMDTAKEPKRIEKVIPLNALPR